MIEVTVGHKLVDKCVSLARKMNSWHRSRGNTKDRKWTKSGMTISRRIDMSSTGFMAECAVSLFLELDPKDTINWNPSKYDLKHDIKIGNVTIDVKSSDHPGASKLMWPIKKIATLDKAADILLFARVPKNKSSKIGQVVELVGFINKERFIKEHKKASNTRGIVNGTPYLNEEDLYKVKHLKHYI